MVVKRISEDLKLIQKNIQSMLTDDEIEQISDGYHTFEELYDFRKMYNSALFNEWAVNEKYDVHKSFKHHDGEYCFGKEDMFVVVAMLPSGQITNHYFKDDWDLFKIPETDTAKYEFDGHTPQDVLQRLKNLSNES